ncbi:hypothetical protein DRQ33_02090 [bacterium]|nr:MAG: hypothetical protein DRQ33_02090 [bacterium]
MKTIALKIKQYIIPYITVLLTAVSTKYHWAMPPIIAGGLLSLIYIYMFPVSAIIIYLLGPPFVKSIVMTPSGVVAIAVLSITGAVSYLGFLKTHRFYIPRMHIFHISVIFLVIWTIITLLWSPTPERGLGRLVTWIFVGILPMFLAYIMTIKQISFQQLANNIIIFGSIFLFISLFALLFKAFGPLERFAPIQDKVAYSRSIGLLFLLSVWLFDKHAKFKRIVVAFMILGSLYFLVAAATRLAFVVSIFFAVSYLLFISRLNLITRISIFIILILLIIIVVPESYLMMRISTIRKGAELSTTLHAYIWKSAFGNLDKIPLHGIGFGGFNLFLPQYLKYIQHPHINFLCYYIETGIIGLLIYLAVMLIIPIRGILLYLKKRYRENNNTNTLYILEMGILIWLYGFCAFFYDGFGSGSFEWIALGIIFGAIQLFTKNTLSNKSASEIYI